MPEQKDLDQDLILPGSSEKFAEVIRKNLAVKRAARKRELENFKNRSWQVISWPFNRLLAKKDVSRGLRMKFDNALAKLSKRFYNTRLYEVPKDQKPRLAFMVFQRAMPMAAAQGTMMFYLAKFGLKAAHWFWLLSSDNKVTIVGITLLVSALISLLGLMAWEEGVWGGRESPKVFKSLRYVYYYFRLRLGLGKQRFSELVQG